MKPIECHYCGQKCAALAAVCLEEARGATTLTAWCYACRRNWTLSAEERAELGDFRGVLLTGKKKAPMPKHRGPFLN